jgi:hypothetical protein
MAIHTAGPVDDMTVALQTGRAWHTAYSALTQEQRHALHGILADALMAARQLLSRVAEQGQGHITQAMPPTAEAD